MKMKHLSSRKSFINESKIPSEKNPFGFYTIANALSPELLFKKLDEYNISYTFDRYSNFILISVSDYDSGVKARELVLSDIFEGDECDRDDIEYNDMSSDTLEIRLK